MRSNRWVLGLLAMAIMALIILGVVVRLTHHSETPAEAQAAGRAGCTQVAKAFHDHGGGQWLTMRGLVSEILPDSHGTSTHQRFILRCPSGQTVLIDNNVDVGRRAPVALGERVTVHGQFIWNELGGLIHDTHHSTDSNPDGWVYAGRTVYR